MFVTMIVCLALIAVPFVVYPFLLWLRARLARCPVRSAAITPTVDLVVCAHNEADVIERKIENALDLDYPSDRLTLWIASDGSTDDTVVRAERLARRFPGRVRVLDLPRTGKAGALISAVAGGDAEVIAFSDANSEWQPDALRRLVAPLNDPIVGGVAGDQRYRRQRRGESRESSGERGYWSFDRTLKRWQAEAGSTVSATGAIYCVRRQLFEPPPEDATDDFMISTGVIAAGRRLAFSPDAVAIEPPAASAGLEFHRKVRVISRGLRSVLYRRALLDPRRSGLYALQLLVHKLWRRLVWLPVLVLLICAPFAMLAGGPAAVLGAMVLAVSTLALIGTAVARLRRYRLFAIPAYVAVVNAACLVATHNLMTGRRITRWHLPRDSGALDTKSAG